MSERKFTATFLSRGQLTIPKSVRHRLKVKPGDRVEIVVLEGEATFIGRLQRGRSASF